MIIPVWNGKDLLQDCLEAILAQRDVNMKIVVVDNGSTDGSAEFVREHYPQVRLIENERNLGYAGGCNTGLRVAEGDALFMVNQDVVVRNDWIFQMCKALADPTIGVIGCKLLYPDEKTIQHAGGIIHWPRAVPDHWGYGETDDGRWDVARDVAYVTGAAWGFRRDVLERVGELDAGFWPGYYEEVDYCFRVSNLAQRIAYVPKAVAIHAESTTLGKGSLTYLDAFHRGRLRFVIKHVPPEQFLQEFVPAELAWLRGELAWGEQVAVGRAYKAALLTLPEVYASEGIYDLSTFDSLQGVADGLINLHTGTWKHPFHTASSGGGERKTT